MVFKCQEDSFLQEVLWQLYYVYYLQYSYKFYLQFTSKIISCEKSIATLIIDGNKQKVEGYDVIMEDTILFPEGGGQVYKK